MRKQPERTFWARLQEALQDAGLPSTQESVATKFGIKQASISEWNKVGGYPTMERTVALAKYAKVCVEWLCTERGPKQTGPPEDAIGARLWAIWRQVTEDGRVAALEAALREGFTKAPAVQKDRSPTQTRRPPSPP